MVCIIEFKYFSCAYSNFAAISFQNIISALTNNGYKVNRFIFSTKGNYSQIDCDWNYKDILHLDTIHGVIKSHILCQIGKKSASYIAFQKLPFVGIKIPLSILVYEHSPFNHVHVSNIGPIIILIPLLLSSFATLKVIFGSALLSLG